MPKIFISHSWEDNEVSRKLAANLKRDGAEIWIDYEGVKAGDSFIKRMNEALDWCDTLILLWSKSAVNSKYVAREWEAALELDKRIIPCILDDTKRPPVLRSYHYINLKNFEAGYKRLTRDLGLLIKEKEPKLEIPTIPEIKKPEITERTSEVKEKEPEKKKPDVKEEPKIITKEKVKPKKQIKTSTRVKTKWHKPVGIIVVCVLLFIVGYVAIQQTGKQESEQISYENKGETVIDPGIAKRSETTDSVRKPIYTPPLRNNAMRLSEDNVKMMLKDKNFFDKHWNNTVNGFENDYELQKNGQVVYDRNSGLMWQRGGSDYWMTYEEAKTRVEQLDFAGYDDWRLPTLEEAMSLVESEENSDGFYIDSKFDKTQHMIWTSDLVKGESWAWVVYFASGYCRWSSVLTYNRYVRAVRSVQPSQE